MTASASLERSTRVATYSFACSSAMFHDFKTFLSALVSNCKSMVQVTLTPMEEGASRRTPAHKSIQREVRTILTATTSYSLSPSSFLVVAR